MNPPPSVIIQQHGAVASFFLRMRRVRSFGILLVAVCQLAAFLATAGACGEGPPFAGEAGTASATPAAARTTSAAHTSSATPVTIPEQAITEETRTATEALGAKGVEVSVSNLITMVRDPTQSEEIRYWSAVGLGGLGDEAASVGLLELLEDDNKNLRYAAATSLGKLRLRSAIPKLREALNDPDAGVRSVAVQGLSYIGTEAAVDALVEKLTDVNEAEDGVRYEAARRLGMMMAFGAEPALLNALNDRSVVLRTGAALALADLGHKAAIPALINVLKDATARESEVVDAIQGLKKLTGLDFGYPKPYFAPATEQEKSEAIRKWIDWWESQ